MHSSNITCSEKHMFYHKGVSGAAGTGETNIDKYHRKRHN